MLTYPQLTGVFLRSRCGNIWRQRASGRSEFLGSLTENNRPRIPVCRRWFYDTKDFQLLITKERGEIRKDSIIAVLWIVSKRVNYTYDKGQPFVVRDILAFGDYDSPGFLVYSFVVPVGIHLSQSVRYTIVLPVQNDLQKRVLRVLIDPAVPCWQYQLQLTWTQYRKTIRRNVSLLERKLGRKLSIETIGNINLQKV